MLNHSGCKKLRTDSSGLLSQMADIENNSTGMNGLSALENNPEHSMRIMHGLNKLKKEKVLCDVTLIAEGMLIHLVS